MDAEEVAMMSTEDSADHYSATFVSWVLYTYNTGSE
jgi:hypothetical protein